jgi:uncharacterized membrane protein
MTSVFVAIDGPNAKATIASAINVHGDIAGRYNDQRDAVHGFFLGRDGVFQTLDIDVPGAVNTVARGINDNGDIVGRYDLPEPSFPHMFHGFIRKAESYTTLDFPMGPGTHTFAWNSNSAGVVVGTFQNPSDGGTVHGFAYDHGAWTRFDHPQVNCPPGNYECGTTVSAIDSAGRMVGSWKDQAKVEHGFLLVSGVFTDLTIPNAKSAFFDAILDDGTTSGVYTDATTGKRRGFVRDKGGRVTTIDRPGLTVVRGINARGDLVGRFVDASAGNKERGYVFWRGFVPGHAD